VYANNVSFESAGNTAPVFGDIAACNLAAMSWVIPDVKWSDHPASGDNNGSGPSYVADLVNAIGNSTCQNPSDGKTYWDSTAIFIVWDDWGGWYDHVNSANAPGLSVNLSCGTSHWGCGDTYGFRVPLLVVSPYTPAGYVSGDTRTQHEVFPYIHEFGSILAFIENNFLGPLQVGQINPQYHFADGHAPDGAGGNIPLSDFFQGAHRNFTTVMTTLPVSYFTNNPAGRRGLVTMEPRIESRFANPGAVALTRQGSCRSHRQPAAGARFVGGHQIQGAARVW
jgi:phospholipase C